jgi:hypothetical protein
MTAKNYLVFGSRLRIGMHNEHERHGTCHADSMPALFAIFDPVRQDHVVGIVRDPCRHFESNAVFGDIPLFIRNSPRFPVPTTFVITMTPLLLARCKNALRDDPE